MFITSTIPISNCICIACSLAFFTFYRDTRDVPKLYSLCENELYSVQMVLTVVKKNCAKNNTKWSKKYLNALLMNVQEVAVKAKA